VYFATKYSKESTRTTTNFDSAAIYILLSGIFLGLALFTKVPAITAIPLIVYLILGKNNTLKRNLRALWRLFIPVILIPLIWPVMSISLGQFDQWLNALSWQATERQQRGVLFAVNAILDIDPVLFILGIAGLIFTVAKKDFTMILWIVPYLVLIYFVGWVTHFHWIPVLPAFCIATAVFLYNLAKKVSGKSMVRKSLSTGIILTIFFFGFSMTLVTITTNVSSHQYQAAEYILKSVKTNRENNLATEGEVTIISSPMYSWLFKYPFEEKNVFSWFRDSSQPISTERILLAVDTNYEGWIENRQGREDPNQITLIEGIYNNTNTRAEFDANTITYNRNTYPYTGIGHARIGASDVEIRTNY
jgi:hypothetical protein